MILQFAIFAQSCSVDRFSNRLSLFNVIDSIEVESFPSLIPEVVFVASMRREDNDQAKFGMTLTIRSGENVIGQVPMGVDFQDKPVTRLIGNFQGMPILRPGTIDFSLPIPGIGEPVVLSLAVTQKQPAQPAPNTVNIPVVGSRS